MKFRFVTGEQIAKLLAARPNDERRRIVALTRFGGLRCVSELVPLRREHVDRDRLRQTVVSPRTAHHEGGESQVVPPFPELEEHLDPGDAFAAEKVVPPAADAETNLGTQFTRIIEQAGLEPWSKPFRNLRATRQTELSARFPERVVCFWIGNTVAVARRHDLRVTDADFRRAAAWSGVAIAPASRRS